MFLSLFDAFALGHLALRLGSTAPGPRCLLRSSPLAEYTQLRRALRYRHGQSQSWDMLRHVECSYQILSAQARHHQYCPDLAVWVFCGTEIQMEFAELHPLHRDSTCTMIHSLRPWRPAGSLRRLCIRPCEEMSPFQQCLSLNNRSEGAIEQHIVRHAHALCHWKGSPSKSLWICWNPEISLCGSIMFNPFCRPWILGALGHRFVWWPCFRPGFKSSFSVCSL